MSYPNLEDTIQAIIESRFDAQVVPRVRRVDMVMSLAIFVYEAIDKYYKGQIEHGGDICDRDLKREIRQEQIDQFWFTEAEKWNAANESKC